MGHGWGYGRGQGWRYRRWWRRQPVSTPEGLVYLEPCRWGHHAYWQTPEGKIVPLWAAPPPTPEEEIEDLKAYKSCLEEELEVIRKRIESLEKTKEESAE